MCENINSRYKRKIGLNFENLLPRRLEWISSMEKCFSRRSHSCVGADERWQINKLALKFKQHNTNLPLCAFSPPRLFALQPVSLPLWRARGDVWEREENLLENYCWHIFDFSISNQKNILYQLYRSIRHSRSALSPAVAVCVASKTLAYFLLFPFP